MKTDWKPMAPTYTATQGQFSFLIAFGRQLERALELERDGSAPEWLTDTLGVLQNALEGITGEPVDHEEPAGGDDADSDTHDDSASGVATSMASRGAPRHGGRGAVVSPMVGLAPSDMKCIRRPDIAPRHSPVAKPPKPGRAKRASAKPARKGKGKR